MLVTGSRIGEILAMRWEDTDLAADHPTVTICGTIVYLKGRGFFRQECTKSDAGLPDHNPAPIRCRDAAGPQARLSRQLPRFDLRLPTRHPGSPPQPTPEPERIQCRVSARGALVIAGQKIQVGMTHAGGTLDVKSVDHTFRVYDHDELICEVPRTTTRAVTRFKVRKPEPPRHSQPGATP